MKIEGVSGEFAFRALYSPTSCRCGESANCEASEAYIWRLSDAYYLSLKDAKRNLGHTVRWPVEIYENGSIYIPSEEEIGAVK